MEVPYSRGTLTPVQEDYNRRLKNVRSSVERTIGCWKSRFRSMHRSGGSLHYSPQKSSKLIVASLVLHNICRYYKIELMPTDEEFMQYVLAELDEEGGD
jgi:hypothetical protein